MPINVFLPYYAGDAELAVNLLVWIHELGGCKNHRAILITDPASLAGADDWPVEEKVEEINRIAKKCFKSVTQIYTPYRRRRVDGTSAWPMGANWSFFSAAFYSAMTQTEPFLWLEPDAIPLKENWIKSIEEEYYHSGKKMMGAVLDTNMPEAHPKYLNGVAVYCAKALRYYDAAMVDFLCGGGHAFDVAAAKHVVPESHPSNLFYHFWGTDLKTSPTFKAEKGPDDPWNVFTLGHIPTEAVLYHRVKDSSLVNLLRAKRNESKLAQV